MNIEIKNVLFRLLHSTAATLARYPAIVFFAIGYLYGFYCLCKMSHMSKAALDAEEQLVGWYSIWILAWFTSTVIGAGWAIYSITQMTVTNVRDYLTRKLEEESDK